MAAARARQNVMGGLLPPGGDPARQGPAAGGARARPALSASGTVTEHGGVLQHQLTANLRTVQEDTSTQYLTAPVVAAPNDAVILPATLDELPGVPNPRPAIHRGALGRAATDIELRIRAFISARNNPALLDKFDSLLSGTACSWEQLAVGVTVQTGAEVPGYFKLSIPLMGMRDGRWSLLGGRVTVMFSARMKQRIYAMLIALGQTGNEPMSDQPDPLVYHIENLTDARCFLSWVRARYEPGAERDERDDRRRVMADRIGRDTGGDWSTVCATLVTYLLVHSDDHHKDLRTMCASACVNLGFSDAKFGQAFHMYTAITFGDRQMAVTPSGFGLGAWGAAFGHLSRMLPPVAAALSARVRNPHPNGTNLREARSVYDAYVAGVDLMSMSESGQERCQKSATDAANWVSHMGRADMTNVCCLISYAFQALPERWLDEGLEDMGIIVEDAAALNARVRGRIGHLLQAEPNDGDM